MSDKVPPVPKLLVISNTHNTGPLWVMSLQMQKNLRVVLEQDPDNAVARWAAEVPDLIILDVVMANATIIALISTLRIETSVPILLMTSQSAEEFFVSAYEAGIDEVVVKPVGPSLFLAKVRSWLRRSGSVPIATLNPLRVGGVRLLPEERVLILEDGQQVRLTNLELRVLYYLMSQAGRVVSNETLVQHIWGSNEGDAVALKNIIYRFRQKVEADPANPRLVQTVSGVGYRFALTG